MGKEESEWIRTFSFTFNTRSPVELSGHDFKVRLVRMSYVFLPTHSVAQKNQKACGG